MVVALMPLVMAGWSTALSRERETTNELICKQTPGWQSSSQVYRAFKATSFML